VTAVTPTPTVIPYSPPVMILLLTVINDEFGIETASDVMSPVRSIRLLVISAYFIQRMSMRVLNK